MLQLSVIHDYRLINQVQDYCLPKQPPRLYLVKNGILYHLELFKTIFNIIRIEIYSKHENIRV